MNRQERYVNLIPAYENASGYFAFQGDIATTYKFKAWNVQSMWEPQYYGSTTDESLSGKRRGNFRGYRLKVSIMLDNSTESSPLRGLFGLLSGGFDRVVWETEFNATTGGGSVNNFVISNPVPSADDWLITTVASGFTGTVKTALVTDYASGTSTVTVNALVETVAGSPVYFLAQPNLPTVILFDVTGESTTYNDSSLIPCNVTNNNYGASRESTISQQRIGIELESVELFKEIPLDYIIT